MPALLLHGVNGVKKSLSGGEESEQSIGGLHAPAAVQLCGVLVSCLSKCSRSDHAHIF